MNVDTAKNNENVPPDFPSAKSRYDYNKRQSKMLKDSMDRSWPDGSTGDTSLDMLTFSFDHQLGLASRSFMKLGLSAEIERQVVKAHEDGFDASKAYAIRNLTRMT
jgi:hypothetical protein